MSFLRTTPEPTLEDRLNGASASVAAATHILTEMVAELDSANRDLDTVIGEAKDAIAYHEELVTLASVQRAANAKTANRLAELVAV